MTKLRTRSTWSGSCLPATSIDAVAVRRPAVLEGPTR
jgi:hypothetical protein